MTPTTHQDYINRLRLELQDLISDSQGLLPEEDEQYRERAIAMLAHTIHILQEWLDHRVPW